MDWIAPLGNLTLADTDRVGPKAAHLGAMMRAGFPVPDGFVITVDAFVNHFGEHTDALTRPGAPQLQPELMAGVADALRELLGDEAHVAVRSSSTTEDSLYASFAGMHSTYYFVAPTDIDRAILDCWMSLWSDAAISYHRSGWNGLAGAEPARMAVIVQKMLPATRSGVSFSRDPTNPEHQEIVIEAAWGLGAALVDGRVTPDHIRLNDNARLTSYEISDKQFEVSPHDQGGERLQEVAPSRRREPVLSSTEAEHLGNLSQQLETLFEAPQDIEWAYVGDELYILQSRPIASRTSPVVPDDELVLFKPLAENFTEPLTPLSADLFARILPRIGAIHDGRVYLQLAPLRRFNPFHLTDAQLVSALLLKSVPEKLQLNWPRVPLLVAAGALAYLADGANWRRSAQLSDAGLNRFGDLVERVLDDNTIDPLQALRRLIWGRHFFEPIGHRAFYVNFSAGRYFLLLGMLRALVRRWAPQYPLQNLSAAFHGHTDLQSMNLLTATDRLAAMLAETLAEDDTAASAIQAVLQGRTAMMPENHPFTDALHAFLDEFGHRGPREMELAAPSWREQPGALFRLLKGHSAEAPRAEAHGSYLATLDELHQHLNAWKRRVVDHLIGRISCFIALRENSRHQHIAAFDAARRKILKVEQRLLDQGALKTRSDIFFLRYPELIHLTTGELDPAAAQARSRRRRRAWHRACREAPAQAINVDMYDVLFESGETHQLRGQGACPGIYEGRARLVRNLTEAHLLEPGEVLVAPYTDPGWTPLFPRAGAIVVGTGSFLSHAGNVARELRIPCVVDVQDCMARIEDGQPLLVDATKGTVEILQ